MSDKAKRVMDIGLCLLLSFLLSPLLLCLGLAVVLDVGWPPLFCQRRPGIGGKPFTIYKFRTMRNATDSQGRPLPDEQRLTRLGRFLRSLSLDELPQLFNVLKGDMSLVGPRPLLMEYLERYSPEQARRHEVRPGVTGWAQVSGRNALSWDEEFALDVWYVDHRTLSLDLKILLLTVGRVLRREGIVQPGRATRDHFLGSPAGRDKVMEG
jgi:sugar transferase EpsL